VRGARALHANEKAANPWSALTAVAAASVLASLGERRRPSRGLHCRAAAGEDGAAGGAAVTPATESKQDDAAGGATVSPATEPKQEVLTDEMLFANDGVPDGEKFDASKQIGVTGPFGFFDPLGLSNDMTEETFRAYRASEIKHGRVAMMASIGGVFAHFVRFPGFAAYETPKGIIANIFTAPGCFGWSVLLLVVGFLELGVLEESELREPGNFGDPFGVGMYDEDMRNRELNNGRFAMFAAFGILTAEFYTGKDAVEQLGLGL